MFNSTQGGDIYPYAIHPECKLPSCLPCSATLTILQTLPPLNLKKWTSLRTSLPPGFTSLVLTIPTHTLASSKTTVPCPQRNQAFPRPALAAPLPRPPPLLAAHCHPRQCMITLHSQTPSLPCLLPPPPLMGISGHLTLSSDPFPPILSTYPFPPACSAGLIVPAHTHQAQLVLDP